MTRLTDVDMCIAKIKDMPVTYDAETVQRCIEIVSNAPTIDAEPVRHGKWIRQTDTRFGEMLNDILICSECNIAFSTLSMIRRSYCPNCGARMDEEND